MSGRTVPVTLVSLVGRIMSTEGIESTEGSLNVCGKRAVTSVNGLEILNGSLHSGASCYQNLHRRIAK